jgi:site-specific DNA-methyltransferase (adenine-specific)
MIDLKLGDCLEVMKSIPDRSIDAIICDLPYGTTACKWDIVIPFEPLWDQYKRIIKDNCAIVLFGSEPFSSALRISNIKDFRYDWIWDKRFGANFGTAKIQPIKRHEIVSIFGVKKSPRYFPQMIKRDKPIKIGKNSSNESDRGMLGENSLNKKEYDNKIYDEKYPESIQFFNVREDKDRFHPTQKPIALMEYLVKTYTNQGDTVLDNCMGSGTTGVACKNLGRNFIGIEQDANYFEIAKNRIESCKQ